MLAAAVPARHDYPMTMATLMKPPSVTSTQPNAPVIIEEKRVEKNGEEKITKYEKGKLLGKGGFAKCFEMKDLATGKVVAGKVVEKSTLTKQRAVQKLKMEIRIHRSLYHKHIVRFEKYFEDSHNVYIMLEMCNHKSMMELIKKRKRLTEPEVRYYMFQVIDALQYMHGQAVIHRDLKLGNLFLHNMDVKIGDFGLATKIEHEGERRRTVCGTPNYIAPEILAGADGHSFEVDIWALGVIMYTLLIGVPPFETSNVEATYKRIKNNVYRFPDDVNITEAARSIIKETLQPIPENRPTLSEMLQHPFFTQGFTPLSLPESALSIAPTFDVAAPSYSAPLVAGVRSPLSERTNTVSIVGNPTEKNAYGKRTTDVKEKVKSPSALEQKNKMMKVLDTEEDMKEIQKRLMGAHISAPATSAAQPPASSAFSVIRNKENEQLLSQPQSASNRYNANVLASASAASHAGSYTSSAPSSSSHPFSLAQPLSFQQQPQQPTAITSTYTAYTANTNFSIKPDTRSEIRSENPESRAPSAQNAPTSGANNNDYVDECVNENDDQYSDSDRKTIEVMHKTLAESFSVTNSGMTRATSRSARNEVALSPPSCWVLKWVDYSNKYGLGYQLSDSSVGAYFNDCSKITLSPDEKRIEYLELVRGSAGLKRMDRKAFANATSAYPPNLQKKITLLNYFKNYLAEHNSGTAVAPSNRDSNAPLVYVQRWFRTKHAIVFRLSNKTVQVNFFDHTKVMLSQEGQVVTYVNKRREKVTQSLPAVSAADPADKENADLINRLKYTRDILLYMLSKNKKETNVDHIELHN